MSDAINPDHYKRLPAEAIEIIESMIAGAPDNKAAYLHGQAAKYDLRLWEKGKSLEDYLADLGKHIWYALRLESHLLGLIEKQKADEQQEASDLQSLKDHPFGKLKQPKWTPKVGDWVRIRKPSEAERDGCQWLRKMDKYDGLTLQYCKRFQFDESAIVYEGFAFLFDWLEPAEQPNAPLNSDTIPEGYRKLNDSSEQPRQIGDLRWSVSQKRYVEITVDEIGYANRDNWAACRKVEPVIKQSLTPEPPEGWRWLEVGEILRIFDATFNSNGSLYELNQEKAGRTVTAPNVFIRRNRFEVGEKVVRVVNGVVYKVIRVLSMGYQLESEFCAEVILHGKDLAPYIEDAK